MKRWLPIIITIFAIFYVTKDVIRTYRIENTGFDLQQFSEIPAQTGGRVKPLDSIARNHLMILRGRTAVPTAEDIPLPAIQWLLEVAARPEYADTLKVFRIDHPDLLGLFGWTQDDKYYSFRELEPNLPKLVEAFQAVPEQSARRNAFERAVVKLYGGISLYHGLIHSFHPPDNSDRIAEEYASFMAVLAPGMDDVRVAGTPEDAMSLGDNGRRLIELLARYRWLSENASLGVQPPPSDSLDQANWLNVGEALLMVPAAGELPYVAENYAGIIAAYRAGDPERFNTAVGTIIENIEAKDPGVSNRVVWENRFNRSEVFYNGTVIYILAMIFVFIFWLRQSEPFRLAASRLLLVGFIVHTIGIIARILIQGYAPITNLYSSAVFVGWGAVGLGLILERVFRTGIAAASAAVVGFTTLIIAHHLSKSGDTMEMMRAVLDSNFWLATHVTIVTLGYVGTFLAGFMAIFFLIRGIFTRGFTRRDAARQANMVYATVCFAILFSFLGTMLGGIWADQSWGRFWGWDPKENGALLVVLWNAVILHARWGGIVRNRGLMVLAVGGNIITSWSWFGTNMLGVGLHSYGFIDSAFFWLALFIFSQIAIMVLGLIPRSRWKSPKAA